MSLARDYVSLLKLRVVLMLDATAIGVMIPAAHGHPNVAAMLAVFAGGTFAAGGAHAINCWFDRDIDAEMNRTRRRPLPSGRIPAWHALAIGIVLNALAFAVLWAGANLLAAVLALAGALFYVFVYTFWLKRSTPQNIVIGGAAGASAPLIAWTAVTGHIGLPAVLMAAIIFLWTPPHFWALSLYRREDYARAGIPMLPVTHGEAETRRQILWYSLALVPATLALAAFGVVGPFYWIPAAALGLLFIYYAQRLFRTARVPEAIHLFRFSILYLFLLFVFLTMDALVRNLGRGGSG